MGPVLGGALGKVFFRPQNVLFGSSLLLLSRERNRRRETKCLQASEMFTECPLYVRCGVRVGGQGMGMCLDGQCGPDLELAT